jgi:carboxymethylenebutenolidase
MTDIALTDSVQGYLAVPPSGFGPVVIVIQEWWGLNDQIRRTADRFAADGFLAFAPDFYNGVVTKEPDEAAKLMMGLEMPRVAQITADAADALVALPESTGPHAGVSGYCMGGGLALLAPTVSSTIVATSAYYPATPWADYKPHWGQYNGKSAQIHTSEGDGGPTAEHIVSAADAIIAGGGHVVVFDYPGTQHAFTNDDRPEVYDAAATDLSWGRTVELFRSKLG